MSFPGGLTPPALSNASLTAVEPEWPDFPVDSFDVEGDEAEEVLPAAPFLSLSRDVEWDREHWVWVCEVLRCLLSWEISNSMASSVEEAWLLAFPGLDRFGSALAASWLRAPSSAEGDSWVTENVTSIVFFPVTAEELGVVVAAEVVVTTAWETVRLEVVTVVVVEGGTLVLPEEARGMTVSWSGFLKAAWNPSVVPCG